MRLQNPYHRLCLRLILLLPSQHPIYTKPPLLRATHFAQSPTRIPPSAWPLISQILLSTLLPFTTTTISCSSFNSSQGIPPSTAPSAYEPHHPHYPLCTTKYTPPANPYTKEYLQNSGRMQSQGKSYSQTNHPAALTAQKLQLQLQLNLEQPNNLSSLPSHK